MSEPLKLNGVGRDAEHEQALCFYFDRKPTDEEMRFLHEALERETGNLHPRKMTALPDWPPRVSATGLREGHRRFGSTGQLFEVRNGRWVRIKKANEQ